MDYLGSIMAFKKVYDCQSYSTASKELFVSQPAISKKIKNLESIYQEKLLLKKDNNILLTPFGTILYEEAIKIEKIRMNTNLKMDQAKNENNKTRIGITENIFMEYIVKSPKDNSVEYIVESDVEDLIEKFNDNIVSKLLLPKMFKDEINYVSKELLYTIKYKVICSHEIDLRENLEIKDLENYEILISEKNLLYDSVNRIKEDNEFNLSTEFFDKISLTINLDELFSKCIVNENTIAIVPEAVTLSEDLKNHLKEIVPDLPEQKVYLFTRINEN